jgi:hypothetical protein
MFEIFEILEAEDNTWSYNGIVNGVKFQELSLREVVEFFEPYMQSSTVKPKFKVLFRCYVECMIAMHKLTPRSQVMKMGFYDHWYLPNHYAIKTHAGIMSRIRDALADLFTRNFTEKQALWAFQEQYKVTTLEYKDVIFAWACMQCFFFPLIERTNLIPFIFLWGEGDAGISSMGKAVTVKWFDHLGKDDAGLRIEVINSSQTAPNVREFMASVNLGIVIDDMHLQYGEDVLALFKTILTNLSAWQIKNKQSKQEFSSVYKAPPFFTGNDLPKMFKNPQMIQRGIIIPVKNRIKDTTQNIKNGESYNQTMVKIPNGLIGWYIFEKTKDWTKQDLLDKYDKMPNLYSEESKHRSNTIYKLFQLGKQFCKEWFGIELDLTALPSLIHDTKKTGNDQFHAGVSTQLREGDITDPYNLRRIKDGDGIKEIFEPNSRWITTPVYTHTNTKSEPKRKGKVYCVQNLRDLYKYLDVSRDEQASLPQFLNMIKPYWPDAEIFDYPVRKVNPLSNQPVNIRNPIFIPDEVESKPEAKPQPEPIIELPKEEPKVVVPSQTQAQANQKLQSFLMSQGRGVEIYVEDWEEYCTRETIATSNLQCFLRGKVKNGELINNNDKSYVKNC